ncbi:hypothetical protein SGRI78S_06749 [Streptomyces griseus subsp. griseus]
MGAVLIRWARTSGGRVRSKGRSASRAARRSASGHGSVRALRSVVRQALADSASVQGSALSRGTPAWTVIADRRAGWAARVWVNPARRPASSSAPSSRKAACTT